MAPSTSVRALAGVAILGSVVAAGLFVSPTAAGPAVEAVVDDPFLFGLVVLGLYLLRPLVAWPTTPLAVIVGYGYGVAVGVPVALGGVCLTVVPTYVAVRWLENGRRPAVDSASRGYLERAVDVSERYYEATGPVRGVVASRLAPIPSDVSTAAAAASGIKLRHLLFGTALGELPWTVAAVAVGASAATITTEGIADFGGLLAVAGGVGAVLLLAGPVYRLLVTDAGEPAPASGPGSH
ncbi:TVP38/TMEM64 family protein [Natrononativus amylolyticus]|uniref:TVP38/TMEM64 family protein n=1 Tax=Natrononativus amylolyticus TaxID=2963434 RepID=UPI0020CCDF83|nr:VTT domain-containing protein [Natrononativus amylolyticus]